MQVDNMSELSTDEALEIAGQLIDLSLELHKTSGLEKAFTFLENIRSRPLNSLQEATLHYFWGNAWSNIRCVSKTDTNPLWNWKQDELEQEISHLRRALQVDDPQELPKQLLCRILTNLGNLLNHVGRFVDAIEYWNRALTLLPDFSMAQANRGLGLCHYASVIYERHDAIRFVKQAKRDLEKALNSQSMHQAARATFERYLQWAIETDNKNDSEKHVFAHLDTFGKTDEETKYRKWVAKNHLFLNFLNDIQIDADVAQDNLMLPSIVQPIGEGPHYHGLFNQLKQEFVSARYLYYEGVTSEDTHFSDNAVKLYNTLDYPSYSLAVEKIKIAFRVAYSIFDKVAFFLNSYLKLGIKERQVSFRTCWYQKQNSEKGLRKEFTDRQNWPLRGLFWLSKDLFEDSIGFRDTIEPDAQEFSTIRNHLEHKYLKVHEFGAPKKITDLSYFYDDLAYSVGRYELADKTIRVLKLIRATLIYLSLAVYYEEGIRSNSRNLEKIPNMEMTLFEDDWKF